jgi:tetratricopeptide (TPR) repeat protein
MTAMRYKGHSLPADEIGKQLGVDHILEGSVRRSAGRVRITVQLISVREQAQLWAESYDRKLENILDIQRDVARRVSRSLAMELLPARQAPQTLGCTRNAAAHDAYLRGRFFWNRRTEESSRKAIGLFEEAIAADPGYGLAHAGLAEAYVTFALLGGVDPQIARSKTHQAALRALEIDPGLAEAHAAFGYATALFERRWAGGVRELQAAAALNANCVTAHMWYGHLLAIAGRFDDALASIDSALQLDPLSILVSAHKGWILYFARRFAEAEALLATVVEMDPSFPLSTYFLGLNWLQMGKSAQAAAHLQRAVDLVPGHPGVLSALARARALEGRRDEALRIREELEKLQARRRVAPYFCACLELTLGNSKRAMDLIEDAWDEGCGLTSFLNVDPALDDLRANPRFQRLARLADGGLR